MDLSHHPIPNYSTKNRAHHLSIANSYFKQEYNLVYDKDGCIILESGKRKKVKEFISPIVFIIKLNNRVKCLRWVCIDGEMQTIETNM